jgi:hypothetical protein
MNGTAAYLMNPATDTIVFGDELAVGMQVLPENRSMRYDDGSEDSALRAQRFRTIIRIRYAPAQVTFLGEWVDGYQEIWAGAITHGWIVRKEGE